jgi:ubiquinone/menaquinone biosynthesis C-methylase UbiE
MSESPIRRSKPLHELKSKYDELAPSYSGMNAVTDIVFGVRRYRRRVMSKARGAVLDIACGTGENFPFFTDAESIIAVDLSEGMLNLAQQRAVKLGQTIEFHIGNAESLDFPDDSFDTVTSALSTCTIPDPVKALQEMKRVCKPDGRILLLEHGRSSWGWVGRFQERRAPAFFEQNACRWDQEPMDNIRAAGLNVVLHQRAFLGVFHMIEATP